MYTTLTNTINFIVTISSACSIWIATARHIATITPKYAIGAITTTTAHTILQINNNYYQYTYRSDMICQDEITYDI